MDVEIFNPHKKPNDELPIIFGFNNGGGAFGLIGQLIAEDGTPLGNHLCSSEGFMPGDLGVRKGSRADRHETFQAHYPDGYRMEFVSYDDVQAHEKLMAAIDLANDYEGDEPDTASVKIETSEANQ